MSHITKLIDFDNIELDELRQTSLDNPDDNVTYIIYSEDQLPIINYQHKTETYNVYKFNRNELKQLVDLFTVV
jgi:hypothetical protein